MKIRTQQKRNLKKKNLKFSNNFSKLYYVTSQGSEILQRLPHFKLTRSPYAIAYI